MKKLQLSIQGKSILIDFKDHFANLVKLYQSLTYGSFDNYKKMGLTYVDVPEIVGITGACENVDTLFKVNSRLNLPLFFTQTGQLSLEQALQSFPGAYTVIHSGRDEEDEDERHLRQFRLTEEEFDCTLAGMNIQKYDEEKMFEKLLEHIQKTVQAMLECVLTDNSKILKKDYKRDINKLQQAVNLNFLRIDYEDAVKLLNKNGFPDVSFGDDLKAAHEAKIVEILNKGKELPVFITKYPKEIKFFNMKVFSKDERVVLSADLIFPYAGEGTGSAVREHDFSKLNERLLTSNMYRLHVGRGGTYQDFAWYLNIIKAKKTKPHAGYGIGNERVMQYILGAKDIRQVSVFSLLSRESGDWDKEKYGHAAILNAEKKHILLSIGKNEDKKYLLPYIKKLSKKSQFVLYATEKTHLFLKKNRILTLLVYKISQIGKNPNISDLLNKRVFDLIINIPTRSKLSPTKEFTDGKLIRKGAVELGISLITDLEVATVVIENLAKNS